jgi:hypothetical protein
MMPRYFSTAQGGEKRRGGGHSLPIGRVVYEMAMLLIRQERHFEPAVRRILGAN